MTFNNTEISRQTGSPITLYLFRYGSNVNSYFALTDSETPITFDHGGPEGAVTYAPTPVTRSAVNASGTLDKSRLSVMTSSAHPLAALYYQGPPSYVVALTIRQGHANLLTDFPVCWTGKVLGAGYQDDQVTFSCEPISSSLRRTGVRRRYQYGCPHVLYGEYCNANKTAATYNTTVLSKSSSAVTLPSGWNGPRDAKKFTGGLIQWQTAAGNIELRTVLRVVGNVLTLNGGASDLTAGQAVTVTLGCNHQMADCTSLHVEVGTGLPNTANFGGQPWIPLKNPILSNIF